MQPNSKFLLNMETKDELLSEGEKYFEKVMQDFNDFTTSRASRRCSCCQTPCNLKYTFMTKRMMTKDQSEDFERYMECVRGLDEDQVSRLAEREYETVQEMYEELKKEMLIKHERDQKRISELKQQIAAKNAELARKEALKKELESQILLEKAETERLASHCMKAAK